MTAGPPTGDDRKLEVELRAVAEARSQGLAGHPSPQELVDYHLGVLPSEEADHLQEHLSFCRECSQVVIDLVAFSGPAEKPLRPATDLDREWDRLQDRLQRESGQRATRPLFGWRLALAVAASLLLVLGLFGWNLSLRKDLREAPRADIAMADLAPERRGVERAAEAPVRVRLRPDQARLLLVLNLGDLREFPAYRIELIDPDRGVLWEQSGIPRTDEGTFLLEIPSRMLAPKLYEVRLYGETGRASVFLAKYLFEIVRGETPSRDR
jgi:hypothetical protein